MSCSLTFIRVLRIKNDTENWVSCHDVISVVTDVIVDCRYDNLRCHQWQHFWRHDDSQISMSCIKSEQKLPFLLQTSEGVNSDHIRWGEAFVVVFSVTSASSFRSVEGYVHRVLRQKRLDRERPPVLIVANKSDLCHHSQVSEEDINGLSDKLRCPAYRTSASDDYPSVVEAFTNLFDQALARYPIKSGQWTRRNGASKIAQIRETLKSLAEFRNRTNTF